MDKHILTTISLPKKVKVLGQKGAFATFGAHRKLSAYIASLIIKDCKTKNIK